MHSEYHLLEIAFNKIHIKIKFYFASQILARTQRNFSISVIIELNKSRDPSGDDEYLYFSNFD